MNSRTCIGVKRKETPRAVRDRRIIIPAWAPASTRQTDTRGKPLSSPALVPGAAAIPDANRSRAREMLSGMPSLLAGLCASRMSPRLRAVQQLRPQTCGSPSGHGHRGGHGGGGGGKQGSEGHVMAEMRAARGIVKRSISPPAADRKALLRELQVKWHRERPYGDEATRESAVELSLMVDAAANVPRATPPETVTTPPAALSPHLSRRGPNDRCSQAKTRSRPRGQRSPSSRA